MVMEANRFRFSGVLKSLFIGISVLFLAGAVARAQEVPYGKSIPISNRDRVYTADQISNTVSVIDPSNNQLLGVIRLGDPITAVLSPLYKGQLLVHGLGFSPDHRTLAVISIGSNSVTLIDTATNKVKGTLYIGRSPHEGFFTPNGKELWVAVRGEDYISVIDPVRMKEIRRIQLANGPGMVLFRPDGRYAFVPSSFTPELSVVDVKSYKVIAKVKQVSPFSPNLAVSPDGSEVWFTLKDVGKTQIISAKPPFTTLATLDTGPITNHVNFVDNANGHFAYVTVGGLNQVKVYRRGTAPELVATIPVGNLPHGIWPSGDGRRIYVGLENGDGVQVIDTLTNQTIATIPVGQLPQALVYVPDAVPSGAGASNLVSLKEIEQPRQVAMKPPSGQGNAQATVVINSLGQVDQLQIAAAGLEPGQEYELYLADAAKPPYGSRILLAKFKASPAGTAIAQTIGPIRNVTSQSGTAQTAPHSLLLISVGNDQPVLVEQAR
jgi:YVTN family beta-propeller protein